jgi:8-oxo-dGTP pyrophosphatase MutT (NUDIX family)
MARTIPEVAKLLVSVTGDRTSLILFSRKRAEGYGKHGRLEFLGGRLAKKERPFEALIRELGEEEESGLLAQRVRAERPRSRTVQLPDAIYHTFHLNITFEDYLVLEPGRHESLGFVLVPRPLLRQRRVHEFLTERTYQLLTELGLLT